MGGALVLVVLIVVLLWYGGCFKKKVQAPENQKSRFEGPGLFDGVRVENPFNTSSRLSSRYTALGLTAPFHHHE